MYFQCDWEDTGWESSQKPAKPAHYRSPNYPTDN